MTALEVEWKEPAPKKQGAFNWEATADELRQNPERWARIHRKPLNGKPPAGSYQQWAKRRLGPDFEVCSRVNRDEDTHDIFARYTPPT